MENRGVRSARRPQLRAGARLGPGIRCRRPAVSIARTCGCSLVVAEAAPGLRWRHSDQTVLDTQPMKNGVVWGVASNHSDASFHSQATLAIKKGR